MKLQTGIGDVPSLAQLAHAHYRQRLVEHHVSASACVNVIDGTVPVQIRRAQNDPVAGAHNLTAFVAAWAALGLPSAVCFSLDDFDASEADCPQVVECVLTLKHRSDISPVPTPAPATMENASQQQHGSPQHGSQQNGSQQQQNGSPQQQNGSQQQQNGSHQQQNGLQQQQQQGLPMSVSGDMGSPVGATSVKYASKQALHNTKGVTKLMQQCTSMLREKMWNDSHSRPAPASLRYHPEAEPHVQPESALEAMGPVLESVLGSLTQEYEKRLLLKDQVRTRSLKGRNETNDETRTLEFVHYLLPRSKGDFVGSALLLCVSSV